MRKDIHPQNYRQVIFLDTSSGEKFLLYSTIETAETDKWEDGKEYPLAKVEISSASHPFYTGKETIVDTAGRVEKFKARADSAKKVRENISKSKKTSPKTKSESKSKSSPKKGSA